MFIIESLMQRDELTVKCSTCIKVFISKLDAACHLASHKRKKNYVCVVCEQQFKTHSKYNSHLQLHIQQEQSRKDEQDHKDVHIILAHHQNYPKAGEQYICTMCGDCEYSE